MNEDDKLYYVTVTEREVQSRKQADHLGGSNRSRPIKLQTMDSKAVQSNPYQEYK